MAANPRPNASKRNKDVSRHSIHLNCFANAAHLSPTLDQASLLRDSAFLAERGILTCVESITRSTISRRDAEHYKRSGEAA
jgi:hypothetical protein